MKKKIEKVYCGIPKLPPIFPRATFDNTLTGALKFANFTSQLSKNYLQLEGGPPLFIFLFFFIPSKNSLMSSSLTTFLLLANLARYSIRLSFIVLYEWIASTWGENVTKPLHFLDLLNIESNCDLLNPAHLPKGFHSSLFHGCVKPWFFCLLVQICREWMIIPTSLRMPRPGD